MYACVCVLGVLYVYDLRHFKKLYQTLRGHTSPVTCISLQNKVGVVVLQSLPEGVAATCRHDQVDVIMFFD